jgi:hypothetical protein
MLRHIIYTAAASALVIATGASADVVWISPGGGLFSDGANWNTGSPPGDFDTAVYNLPNTYTVNFAVDHSLLNFAFRQGHVTFNMPNRMINQGFQFGPPSNIDVGLTSGDAATTTMMGGRINLRGSSSHVNVGAASGSQGVLELRSGAQMTVSTGAVNIGPGGSFLLADQSFLSDGGTPNDFNLAPGGQVSVQSGSGIGFGNYTVGGAVSVTGASSVGGFQWTIPDTGSLTVSGGSHLGWEASLSGAGLVRIEGGSTAGPFGSTVPTSLDNLQVDGAGSTFGSPIFGGGATVTNGGQLNVTTLGSSFNTTGTANVSLSGAGSHASAAAVYNGTLLVSNGATANYRSLDNSSLTVQGAGSRLEGTSLYLPEFGTHSSNVTLQSGAVLNETEQVRLSGGSRIDVESGSQLTTSTLQIGNNTLPGTAIVNVTSGSSITADSLTIGTGASAPGRLILDGTATIGAGGVTVDSDGVLAGSGLIVGDVTNAGHVVRGSVTGLLRIAGPYTQAPGGVLDILLGGTGIGTYDQMTCSAATLAGLLNVSLASGFTPPLGSTFTIVQADQINGGFGSVAFPTLESGLVFNVVYNPTSVTIVTVPAPASAALLAAGLLAAARRRRR